MHIKLLKGLIDKDYCANSYVLPLFKNIIQLCEMRKQAQKGQKPAHHYRRNPICPHWLPRHKIDWYQRRETNSTLHGRESGLQSQQGVSGLCTPTWAGAAPPPGRGRAEHPEPGLTGERSSATRRTGGPSAGPLWGAKEGVGRRRGAGQPRRPLLLAAGFLVHPTICRWATLKVCGAGVWVNNFARESASAAAPIHCPRRPPVRREGNRAGRGRHSEN